MIHALLIASARRRRAVPLKPMGQVQYNTGGTFTWICPEGVTKVSVALVGGGGKGIRSSTGVDRFRGNGANLRYINNVSVTPGQSYTIVVGPRGTTRLSTHSTAFGYSTSNSLSSTVKGADGNRATSGVANTTDTYGGNVGGIATGYNGNGIDLKTFLAVVRNSGLNGMAAGGGGGVRGNELAGEGGHGAVRIIWGENRAFPDLNIGDL